MWPQVNGRTVCSKVGACVVWIASQSGHVDGFTSFDFAASEIVPVAGVVDDNHRQVWMCRL